MLKGLKNRENLKEIIKKKKVKGYKYNLMRGQDM